MWRLDGGMQEHWGEHHGDHNVDTHSEQHADPVLNDCSD